MVKRSLRYRVRCKLTWMLVIVVLIVVLPGCSRKRPENKASPHVKATSSPPFESVRKIYAYSLIPGGIASAAAFGTYRVSDQVLSSHFRDMGAKVFPTSLARDKWMYASYRVSDAIYWTKNRVLVHAGERLLTDGNTLVRARCGNRLSESPETPVQAVQPPAVTTDTFITEVTVVAPPDLIPAIDVPSLPEAPEMTPSAGPPSPLEVEGPYTPAPPPDSGGEVLPVPVPLPPDSGGPVFLPRPFLPLSSPVPPVHPYVPPRVASTIPTPEMSTWILMFTGLLSLTGGSSLRRLSYRPKYGD